MGELVTTVVLICKIALTQPSVNPVNEIMSLNFVLRCDVVQQPQPWQTPSPWQDVRQPQPWQIRQS